MNARINQTEVFTGGDVSKIEKRLRRLARNYKNRDYLDLKIDHALGNLYLSRRDTAKAIENLYNCRREEYAPGCGAGHQSADVGRHLF